MKRIGRLGPVNEKDSCSATQSIIVFISVHTRNAEGDLERMDGLNAWDRKHVATFLFRISFPPLPLARPPPA
jgi:hypothetical protein